MRTKREELVPGKLIKEITIDEHQHLLVGGIVDFVQHFIVVRRDISSHSIYEVVYLAN